MRHRGCSRSLKRAITYFGADVAFAKVEEKWIEHYGIALSESTVWRVTELHADLIYTTAQVD